MKYLVIMILMASCGQAAKIKEARQAMEDSAVSWKRHNDSLDALIMASERRYDSAFRRMIRSVDSVKLRNKVLERKIFVYRFTISRIRYRLDIVDRNPSQLKYLKGWTRRIIRDLK